MSKIVPLIMAITLTLLTLSCRTDGINYSKALFEHIPDDPQLLVLVRPNDAAKLFETAVKELNFSEMIGTKLNIDAEKLDYYKNLTDQMMEALGIPWPKVETMGVLVYFEKPVILVSGDFLKADVEAKLTELGFQQNSNQFFDYIYNDQKLFVAADGLMMMAAEDMLEYLVEVPEERRLWNRPDFKNYRLNSPLDNSLFVWTHPPKSFLGDFPYRDELGDISISSDIKGNFTFQANIRLKSEEKTGYLHDIVLGTSITAGGVFGDDPVFGPVFKAVKVTKEPKEVVVKLVINPDQMNAIKERLAQEFESGESQTFNRIQEFMDKF